MHPLVSKYGLQPHPEGGFYKQVYRSDAATASHAHGDARPAMTHIYFLLLKGQVSRFHKVLHDEIWNFYQGAPLELITFHDSQLVTQTLGDQDGEYAGIVPAGHYQGARSTGDYSLVGCSVAPGFDFSDFSFIEDNEIAKWVKDTHPNLQVFI